MFSGFRTLCLRALEIVLRNNEYVIPSRIQQSERCKLQQNGEESDALELGTPGQCGSVKPEPLADFLLILSPTDQIMNQGTASDKEFQLLQ